MSRHKTRKFSHFLMSGVALAGASTSASSFAQAQVQEDSAQSRLGEIVVTAQKYETTLQDTPIAISVLGSEDLKNRSVQGLGDLMNGGVPSLRVTPAGNRSSALAISIRGIESGDSVQPSRDSGVGIYIDGVFLGRAQGLGAALYDVERIEVLKGPQGTLFGRNSTGGAVSIVTRKPSGELSLSQTLGLSNFDGYRSETHLDLPSFANISVKLDAVITKRDGTVDNPLSGQADFNQYDRRGLHAMALWEPSDRFSADYSFDIARDGTTPYYNQLLEKNPAVTLPPLYVEQPDRVKTASVGVRLQESLGKTHGHTVHLNWKATDQIELRSISAYRKLHQTQFDNGGLNETRFAPNGQFGRYALSEVKQDQFSQELQLLGHFPRVDLVSGLYYFHEKGEEVARVPNTLQFNADGTAYTPLPIQDAGNAPPSRASNAVTDSFAIFGQATYTPPVLDDRLHLTAGARYTREKKHGDLFMVEGAATDYSFRTKSSRIDPMAIAAFDVSDQVNVYAKWGTAYRAGGANARSFTYRAYDPEEVETTEIGVKSELFDRHVRLNLAAYSTRYKNQQIDFLNIDFTTGRYSVETVNARGVSKLRGIEADIVIAPLPGLTLTGSYAYIDSKLRPAANPFLFDALQTVYLASTPKHAYSMAIDYQLPLEWTTIRAHLDGGGDTGFHSSAEPYLTDKSFVVNGRLSLADIDLQSTAKLQLSLWSRNLFNEQHVFYRAGYSYSATGITGLYNEPRTYGIDATVKF